MGNLSQTYYKRRLIATRMHRRVVARRRSIRALRLLIKLLLIISLFALGFFILKHKSWHLNKEKLKAGSPDVVVIANNHITPSYKILNMVRQTPLPDFKIYKLNTRELEHNIELLQSVKKAYVRRFIRPARLLIIIEERKPVFVIAPNLEAPPVSAITQDGIFIGRDFMPLPQNIETVKILSYGTRGDDYEKWDKKRVDDLSKIIKTVETYSGKKVIYIDLRDPNDIYIQLENVLVRLGELNASANKRLEAAATILPQIEDLSGIIKYVDLRWEDAKYIKLKDSSEVKLNSETRFGI